MQSRAINTSNKNDRKGQTITFYSYKGGVGRTMALVNIACLLAKENKKILLIDCDLEAPGLHQFFKTSEETLGFVDLISDADKWISVEENNSEEGYYRFFTEHVNNYISINVKPNQTEADISVDIIKAGKFDKDYSKKLGSINWLEIYKKAPAFFRTFAYSLEKDYDYIFVDARTGLADTSGICTMLLPRKLVLVYALNNQNINGVVDVARQAIDYRFSSNDYRTLDIFPLPARIENSVNPDLQKWIDNYKGKFEELFKEKYLLDNCNLLPYFNRCFIQYYPIHAYGENIPALYEEIASSNFISYNYNNFLIILKKSIPAWEVINLEDELNNERFANEHSKKGYEYSLDKMYDLAIEEYTKAIELKPDFYEAYNDRGIAKQYLKLYEEAIDDFSKAIELNPNFESANNNLETAKIEFDKYIQTQVDYSKSIELKSDYGSKNYLHETPSKRTIKIFISSSELREERSRCGIIINRLNKSHKHLQLELTEWELDWVKGNDFEGGMLPKAINPKLKESDIVVFLFYSKLGLYTKDEFDLAMKEKKKLFTYFKKGFSPKKDSFASYGHLLDFKESLDNTVLYSEYDDVNEFEKLFYQNLNLYLIETYANVALDGADKKLSESVITVIQLLSSKEEEIKQLKESFKLGPEEKANQQQLQQLITEKDELLQELLKSKEIQEQQAKDKAALEQQLSQHKEYDELKAKALAEVEKGNYIEAENYLKETTKTSIEESAATFYELGKIKKLQSQYTEALNYFELAVKINSESSLYLNDAGIIADTLGFYDKAITYYEKALVIDRKYYGEEHPDIASRYNNLGLSYYSKGEYDKAITYYEKALVIDRKYYGEEHPDIASRYNNLGSVYYNKGEYDIAIKFYQKALEIGLKYYGEDHPDIASRYNNLGAAYGSKGEYDKAIEYYEKVLVIDRQYYGEEHPSIAIDYNNLGAAYGSKGEYDKAIEYYERALVIGRKYYGEEHPDIASRYNNLGSMYNYKGDYNKAINYYEHALTIFKKFYGEEHPNIAYSYNDLGLSYYDKGEYPKAIEYFNHSLAIIQKYFSKNHPIIQNIHKNITLVQTRLGVYSNVS